MTTVHLVVGPPRHGVTRLAAQIAEYLEATTATFEDAGGLFDAVVADTAVFRTARCHLHFTDGIFGSNPESAASRIEQLSMQVAGLGVTLHDLPQPSDGPKNHLRRADAYRRVMAVSDRVVVNSEHERDLLIESGLYPGPPGEEVWAPELFVVPLPVDRYADFEDVPLAMDGNRTLGVFGYLYPGKGHAEAIELAARLPGRPTVLALGQVSEGHDDLARELTDHARSLGIDFQITGYLPEDQLADQLSSVTVPLCLHQHISASGSMGSWIAAGRRPLCWDSRYTREMAGLRPGSLHVCAPEQLEDAARRALSDPGFTTVIAGGGELGIREVASHYRRILELPERPEITVVIPYYEPGAGWAQERLDLIIEALGESGPEIIVVDDGSPTPPRVPSQVQVLRQEDLGFRASAARALGVRNARGRVVAFLDADTVPGSGYLAALTGPVVSGEAEVTVGKRLHAHLTGPDEGKILDAPTWLADGYRRTRNLVSSDARSYQFVISSVMAAPRALLDVESFDPTIIGYGGEDWDLAHRLWLRGARFRHVPGAVATHDGPDWAGRTGRGDRPGVTVKNRETIALAERIPAHWHRPDGVLFEVPELLVDVQASALSHYEDLAVVWASSLLRSQPDCRIIWPLQVRAPFDADPRVVPTVEYNRSPRYLLTVHRLFDTSVIQDAIGALDEATEDGVLGGASRRASFRAPDGMCLAELWHTRAWRLGPKAEGLVVTVEPMDVGLIDLERHWAGW